MRIASEEIFGPVVALLKFSTEEEAIAIANDTEYGLGYDLFTQDVTRVHRVMPKIRAGIGWVNFYHPTFNEMPWGIYKKSGTDRELGWYQFLSRCKTSQYPRYGSSGMVLENRQ
ncbi:aldehyde dehydrogenase family protein [Flavobacterium succinicans]|uniref:Betaine aldehyde dehydrogenase n=1 Tax=Flavobacterium succinicans TaxID=29536 RepID=A0A199XTV3_9FLAO|nr:aldehyde dehydrogenase family protein [Flavobacterium succinicans]OAZ04749.1 betaine aldehyde dehydrogenase [Flavobacterium succinicans]